MSQPTPSSRFLGMDLRALWLEFRRSWQALHQWPLLAWLTPDFPVRVWRADGSENTWFAGRLANGIKAKVTRFEALELPDDLLLSRTMVMPAMAQEQIAQAVALEVINASPFVISDLVWGYSTQPLAQGELRIDAVFASRKQAIQYLETQKHRLSTTMEPEVWAFTAVGTPIVFKGWGEARRMHHGIMHRRQAYALLLVALCLVAGILVTPTAQLRLRALDATQAYEAAQQRTAALIGQREAFVRSTDQLQSLHTMLMDRADPMHLLEVLTQTLPDDTSLQSLQVQGLKVTLNGLTTNAAALMQLLGAQKGIKDVRAPSAATRSPGANAENFIIEFQLEPAVLSIAASASVSAISPDSPLQIPVSALAVESTPLVKGGEEQNPTPAVLTPGPKVENASAPRKSRFSSGPEGPSAPGAKGTLPANVVPSTAGNAVP